VSKNAVELIRINGSAKSRDEAIAEAAEMLISAGAVSPAYKDSMFDRESSVSTYMGNYLAIPHGTLEGADLVLSSALAIIRYENPIDWDGNEVRFVIGIAGKDGTHMDSLGKIAQVFSEMETVEMLLEAKSEEQFTDIFAEQHAA
jgi:mannitol/fructose-specific phosphotransferase system IIA component